MKLDLNKFLIFGDSITEFSFNIGPYVYNPSAVNGGSDSEFALGAALVNDYARRMDILYRGYSGYTSRSAKEILPLILRSDHDSQPESKKIKLAYVFFGTNDAAIQSRQTVPVEEYKKNMAEIIEIFKSRDIKPLIITPTYHDEVKWRDAGHTDLSKGWRRTENNLKYVAVLEELAQEYNLPIVNLYEEFTRFARECNIRPEDLLSDGIHFNGKGYQAFYRALTRTIKVKYPEFDPESMDQNLVSWEDSLTPEFIEQMKREC